jgi:hypothetical protein
VWRILEKCLIHWRNQMDKYFKEVGKMASLIKLENVVGEQTKEIKIGRIGQYTEKE